MAFSYAQRSTFCTERRPISFWAVQALLSRGFKQPLEFESQCAEGSHTCLRSELCAAASHRAQDIRNGS